MVSGELLGTGQQAFYFAIMRRDPGGDKRRVLKVLPPEHVLSRAKTHRNGSFIDLGGRCRVNDGYAGGGGHDFMVLIKAGKKGWRKDQSMNRAGSNFCGLDLRVTPARNLHGYMAPDGCVAGI